MLLAEHLHDLVALVGAQQAVVDEHADQLVADRRVQQRRDDRRIDAARQAEQHLVAAHLLAHARDRVGDDVAGVPARLAAADLAHEALEHPRALQRVRDFGVELHARRSGASRRPCAASGAFGDEPIAHEARRQLLDAVAVAHPDVEQAAALRRRA